jgi:hypothetical protein
MASPLKIYRDDLGARLHQLLGADWKFYKTQMSFVKKDSCGKQEIILDSTAKFSPWVDFSLYFRRYFTLEPAALQAVGGFNEFFISQNSHNRAHMKGLPFPGAGRGVWSVNISQPVPAGLPEEFMRFIENTVQPFFAMFFNPEAWRDDLAHGRFSDGWGRQKFDYWKELLVLDLHLHDAEHFESWAVENKLPHQSCEEASKRIENWKASLNA